MKDYSGKWIFITGGSTGIGLAAAKVFAALGGHIVIFARNDNKLAIAKEEIVAKKKNPRQNILSYSVDITDAVNATTILQQAVRENDVPDILLTCVGRAFPDYFEKLTPQHFDETIKANVYSVWNACSVLLPYMKIKGGHIVNTSSMAGVLGVFGYTDYCASKYAVVGFSEALKSEVKRYNIGISVLCPPDTDTPGFEAENINKPAETKAISGNARLLSPDFVAKELVKGIEKKQFMIIPGIEGKLTYLLIRLFPRLVEMIMDSSIRKVQKQKANAK